MDEPRTPFEIEIRPKDQDVKPELTDVMKAELDRRVEAMRRNPNSGVSWKAVKARVLGRLGK